MRKLRKVLIIDDDEMTCYLNKNLLEIIEVAEKVDCVYDGYEALDYVKKNFFQVAIEEKTYPELVFLDITMPRMDGFEFLEELQYVGYIDLGKLHIVMLTSSIDMYDIQRSGSFEHLLKGYITKPLEIGAVKKVLDSIPGNPE